MRRPAMRRRTPKQRRLSPRQQAVLASMAQGWVLHQRVGLRGHCWLQRGSETRTVGVDTVRVLEEQRRVIVETTDADYPRCRYRLVQEREEENAQGT